MRHPFQSEPSQVGPAVPPPGSITPPATQPADAATLTLLARWQHEDATTDPAQLSAAKKELEEFKKALNEARTTSGEPLLFP